VIVRDPSFAEAFQTPERVRDRILEFGRAHR
jgi:hypothetical protein